ncbi:MAG: hypothetical protein IJI23_00675 [Lachnospiraceae bacterium]|nr:hypothetical protein [Lachnospiraceae bacterium]
MRQTAKIITAAFFLSASLFFGAGSVYAEGLNVSADKENCEIGDTVTVTVDATALEGTAPADIQVEFNANRLSFVNCSAEYGGGGGGLITFKESNATVEFTTLSGGTADVKVTATAEDAAEPETASVSVAVAGEDTAAALDAAAGGDLGVSPGTIDLSDGRVIQTVFAEEFKPILFHKETTDYNGQMVECAKFDMGDMTLLYTTDASGADGKFMIYNRSTGNLDEFRMLQGIENRFIIVLADCEGEIPAGYTKAVLDWNGQTLTAFMEESVAAGSATAVNGVDPADFFLVYAMSSEGNKGWYRYDKNEGTYQRFIPSQAGPATEGELQEEADETDSEGFLDDYIPRNIQSILLIVFVALALILLITVIILAVKLHEYAEDLDAIYEGGYYEDDEEDEDEDDEDDEEEDRHVRRGGAVTAASLVGRSMSEEDEQDEEDEEDDEDDEDDDSEEDEEDVEDEEPDDEEDEDDEDGDEEEDDEEEDDDDLYERPLTRRERKELERERKEREREEKWRLKEEKKAAKRRARGYEEATPMDWSSFEKEREQEKEPGKESEQREKLPPRKKVVRDEETHETEQPRALREEEQRERQRRLFEQQQRIEEQRRIENERLEAERIKQQQQFIDSRNEEPDLDEDFQFEFLNLD